MPLPNGSAHRFWCRMEGATFRGAVSPCGILCSPCVSRALSVRCPLRAEPKPRPSGKEGGKEKKMEMQSLPLHLP